MSTRYSLVWFPLCAAALLLACSDNDKGQKQQQQTTTKQVDPKPVPKPTPEVEEADCPSNRTLVCVGDTRRMVFSPKPGVGCCETLKNRLPAGAPLDPYSYRDGGRRLKPCAPSKPRTTPKNPEVPGKAAVQEARPDHYFSFQESQAQVRVCAIEADQTYLLEAAPDTAFSLECPLVEPASLATFEAPTDFEAFISAGQKQTDAFAKMVTGRACANADQPCAFLAWPDPESPGEDTQQQPPAESAEQAGAKADQPAHPNGPEQPVPLTPAQMPRVILLDTVDHKNRLGGDLHGRIVASVLETATCQEPGCMGDKLQISPVFHHAVTFKDGKPTLTEPKGGGDRAYPVDIARELARLTSKEGRQLVVMPFGWDPAPLPTDANGNKPKEIQEVGYWVQRVLATQPKDMVVLAAAGNRTNQRHVGNKLAYPAAYADPTRNFFAVGALDAAGKRLTIDRAADVHTAALGVGAMVMDSVMPAGPNCDNSTWKVVPWSKRGPKVDGCDIRPMPLPMATGTSVAVAVAAGAVLRNWEKLPKIPCRINPCVTWDTVVKDECCPQSGPCAKVPARLEPEAAVLGEPFPSPFPCGHCGYSWQDAQTSMAIFANNPLYPVTDLQVTVHLWDADGTYGRNPNWEDRFAFTKPPVRAAFETRYKHRGRTVHKTFSVPVYTR